MHYMVEYAGGLVPRKYIRVKFLMTLPDAKENVLRWCSLADTIGGHARVVNIKNGRIVYNP